MSSAIDQKLYSRCNGGKKQYFLNAEFRGECAKVEVTVFNGENQRGDSPNSKVWGVSPHLKFVIIYRVRLL